MKRILIILLLCVTAYGQSPYQKPLHGTQVNYGHPLGDMVGLWLMNEGSGKTFTDLSGNSNVLTRSGTGPIWTGGRYGYATDYNGADDYGTITTLPLLDAFGQPDAPYTVCVWFRLDSLASVQGEACLFSISDGTVNDFVLLRVDDDNDELDFSVRQDAGAVGVASTPANSIPANLWGMACAVAYSDSERAVFYNATNKGINSGAIVPNNLDRMHIGARDLGAVANFLTGQISQVYIYDRALSFSEIALLYREPFCMFKEDLPVSMMYSYAAAPPTGSQFITIQMGAFTFGMVLGAGSLVWLKKRAA